jgi:hypothetical protein
MRKQHCKACSFNRFGVRTRISIPHTCGGPGTPRRPSPPYIPTQEELDKYLARLKELMEGPRPVDNVSPESGKRSTE